MTQSFRKATPADSCRIWEMIRQAKAFMASEGRKQWTDAYPAVSDIDSDISNEDAYVLCIDDVPMAYGAVIFTGEPAYRQIEEKWSYHGDYVVVHRLCVADEARGRGLAQQFFNEVSALARAKGIRSFKVDTNYDNKAMLHIMDKCGFTYRGEITYPQGSRLAFEKNLY